MELEKPVMDKSTTKSKQRNWLAQFDLQTKDLDIRPEKHDEISPDEIQIQIEDLGTKISKLQAQLKKHKSKGMITTDEMCEMKDLIEKYSVKLDNIDFMGRTDALSERQIELLGIILKIQKKLEGLKEIDEIEFINKSGLIAEVRDREIEINESAIQSLCSQINGRGKYSFSLVSIAGDRKSGKSRLFKSIQKHAVDKKWVVLTSDRKWTEKPECSGIDCCVLFKDKKDRRRLIFLMDIVCNEGVNSKIYTKLVDFCVLVSYVVFYTDNLEELNLPNPWNGCYWNMERSILARLPPSGNTFLNTPHTYIFGNDLSYEYIGQTSLLQARSRRIQLRKIQNEAYQHNLHNEAHFPVEKMRKNFFSSTFSFLSWKQYPHPVDKVKLYDQCVASLFCKIRLVKQAAGRDLDFEDVKEIRNKFQDATNMINTQCTSLKTSIPSPPPQFDYKVELSVKKATMDKAESNYFDYYECPDIELVGKRAIEKYERYLVCKIGEQIFTDSTIKKFHMFAFSILTSTDILSRMKECQSRDYIQFVNDHLKERQHYFIIQNQNKIMRKVKAREVLMDEGKEMYKELLTRYPDSASYNNFILTARTFTWKLFEKRAKRENLNVLGWYLPFLTELNGLNQEILVDKIAIRTPQIGLEDFFIEFRKLELCVKDEDLLKSSVSLVFHLTPSSLQAAVFLLDSTQRQDLKSESISPIFRHHCSPCILFRANNKAMIGSEALENAQGDSSDSFFNMYELLKCGTQGRYAVKMNKKEETLEVEEIMALFLFKIKRHIETELNIHLTSAAFAMSPQLSTTAKHMVKTSLSLAGFLDSVLLQTKVAASVAEYMLAMNSSRSHSSILLLYDQLEIIQLCIERRGKSLKVNAHDVIRTDESVSNLKEAIFLNSGKLKYFPTTATIMRMSPLSLNKVSSGQTEHLLADALAELKDGRYPNFKNCEIVISTAEYCRILLGAHLYSNSTCERMKSIKIFEDNCNVTGEMKTVTGTSVHKFNHDLDYYNQTKKSRMVLYVKMRGKDQLCIIKKGFERRVVARLTRVGVDHDDHREMEIQIYLSSEGLLDFQLKSQKDAFELETHYLLPHEVEAAKSKLFNYFKTKKIKIEDSWKTFLKNTDSISRVCENNLRKGQGHGERSYSTQV